MICLAGHGRDKLYGLTSLAIGKNSSWRAKGGSPLYVAQAACKYISCAELQKFTASRFLEDAGANGKRFSAFWQSICQFACQERNL
jgi:hypothetical protein